jgi:hypothetical protein
MVTDKQVQLLRLKMAQGKTVEAAAAAAGMSARSAHTWKAGALPSQTKRQRHWRTRVDVFADVWDAEVVPLLERDEAGVLEATTIIAELGRVHGQRFTDKHLRTLQRRVRDWRAMHGPEREVFFERKPLTGCMMARLGCATRLSGRCRRARESKQRQRRRLAYWARFSAGC